MQACAPHLGCILKSALPKGISEAMNALFQKVVAQAHLAK
jgi:hypothetical protein